MTDVCIDAPVRSRQEALVRIPLTAGWEMACAADSRTPDRLDDLRFISAGVPGTAASALQRHGEWRPGSGRSLDADEYWFRCHFEADPAGIGEEVMLEMGGIATVSEAWLNGRRILRSSSMFASHRVDVSKMLEGRNELSIVCRSLKAALRGRRGQAPVARWRTRVVAEQQLRWFRTSLFGRAPGFAAEPAPVGPWHPVALVRRRHIALDLSSRQAELDGTTGTIRSALVARSLRPQARPVGGQIVLGQWSAPIRWEASDDNSDAYTGHAVLRIAQSRKWWPHTHGEPALYPLRTEVQLEDGSTAALDDVPVGFRTLKFETAKSGKAGFAVNGTHVFARGVVWTPPDPIGFSADEDCLRRRLELLRDAGINLIRVNGVTAYECETFHRLCDELGLLVWQDIMFANMDYPFADPEFFAQVRGEAECELTRLARHASSAVVCGNSEIEQQAGMLGLDPALGRDPFFTEELPQIMSRRCPGMSYIPSAPSGDGLPFHTSTGVANYFGVGAYLRPLEDARRANVRFASECLAFANVPEPEAEGISSDSSARNNGVPRDSGASWDFADVRDHYLKLLYSVDPAALCQADAGRYRELSRVVSGEVMAEVFGEWRRPGSQCGGGIILWSSDTEPGAGWGILDSTGRPKAAYWFLKRALAPCAIWTTDEGLNGVDAHVANDGPAPLNASLRIALYAHGERKIEESEREITVAAHSSATFGVEEILGHFVDASRAYKFGPPAFDVIAASLHLRAGESAFAQAFRLPAGRNPLRVPIADLGIEGCAHTRLDGLIEVLLSSRRFGSGVRIVAAEALPDDCYFGIEPGQTRRILLTPFVPGVPPRSLHVTATNAEGRVPIAMRSAR